MSKVSCFLNDQLQCSAPKNKVIRLLVQDLILVIPSFRVLSWTISKHISQQIKHSRHLAISYNAQILSCSKLAAYVFSFNMYCCAPQEQ